DECEDLALTLREPRQRSIARGRVAGNGTVDGDPGARGQIAQEFPDWRRLEFLSEREPPAQDGGGQPALGVAMQQEGLRGPPARIDLFPAKGCRLAGVGRADPVSGNARFPAGAA